MGIGGKKIHFSGEAFSIVRLATGGGYSGVGGTYPVIENYTKPSPRLIIGSEKSGNYALGKFLILPPHEWIEIEGQKILVGCVDPVLLQKIKMILQSDPTISKNLFKKKFSHLTISSRIDVGLWPIFQKKYVLQFIGLPEEAYENASEREPYLTSIIKFKTQLMA